MAKRSRAQTEDSNGNELPEGHRPAEDRETRLCVKCGQMDDHSHHIQYAAFNHPITGEPQDISIAKHITCCAEDGCEICQTDLKHADANGVSVDGPNADLTEYMQNKTEDHHRELFEKHGVESVDHTVEPDEENE